MSGQYSEQLHNPTVESALRQWHEYDGLHRLVGTECGACGAKFFPKRFVCAKCHSTDVSPHRFSGNGTIVNMDAQFLPPVKLMGFRDETDRVLVAVQLDEGPVVISELVDRGHQRPTMGSPVRLTVRRIARSGNGDFRYAFKFVLAQSESSRPTPAEGTVTK